MKQFKKIIYVTSARLPTEKAHGLATVKICEAFADHGYEIDIITPLLWRRADANIFQYYGVKKNFQIFKIPCIDLMPLKIFEKFAFMLQSASFSLFLIPYILLKYKINIKNFIFLSHDYIPLYFITFLPVKIFYDIHHFPGNNFMYKRVMKKSFGFAVQTKWKIMSLHEKFGISFDKIVYWPNGTDIENFNIGMSTNEARTEVGIPLDKKVVMYTGQLFAWKGVYTLMRSVKMLQKDVLVYVIGGSKKDVENCKKEINETADERIIFVSFQQHSKIPLWLRAADVLVLPNTGKQKVSLFYTSPMKLFEYIASRKPVIASATPSIMEILNDTNSVLVEPDDPGSLARGINKIFDNKEFAEKIAENAFVDSKKYTWSKRAQKITQHFENHA